MSRIVGDLLACMLSVAWVACFLHLHSYWGSERTGNLTLVLINLELDATTEEVLAAAETAKRTPS
jgi:hypothetical protein